MQIGVDNCCFHKLLTKYLNTFFSNNNISTIIAEVVGKIVCSVVYTIIIPLVSDSFVLGGHLKVVPASNPWLGLTHHYCHYYYYYYYFSLG